MLTKYEAAKPKIDEKPRAFKRARRVDAQRPTKQLFALLDLDGTVFHMMPEAELPGNIEHVTEAVVPLPAGAMRKLVAKDDETRHLMAVRKGTRGLLASLRAAGVEVRVVTANLLGDAAVEALVVREQADIAADTTLGRGWSGEPTIAVTVVVDRTPGSKKLPDDIVEALRVDPNGTRVAILDDNPTAWEARARDFIWQIPQFCVRKPLTRAELDDELTLLDKIADKCKRFFSESPPKGKPATKHATWLEQFVGRRNRSGSDASSTRSKLQSAESADAVKPTKRTKPPPRDDHDDIDDEIDALLEDDDEEEQGNGDDPDREQTLAASRESCHVVLDDLSFVQKLPASAQSGGAGLSKTPMATTTKRRPLTPVSLSNDRLRAGTTLLDDNRRLRTRHDNNATTTTTRGGNSRGFGIVVGAT